MNREIKNILYKSLYALSLCMKGGKPIGTISEHADGTKWKKVKEGEWQQITEEGSQEQETGELDLSGYWNGKIYGLGGKTPYSIYIDQKKINLTSKQKEWIEKNPQEFKKKLAQNKKDEIKNVEPEEYQIKGEYWNGKIYGDEKYGYKIMLITMKLKYLQDKQNISILIQKK